MYSVVQNYLVLLLKYLSHFSPVLLIPFSSFDKSIEEWRQFHCDLNDLSQWLTEAEGLLAEAHAPDGSLDIEKARIHQQVTDYCVLSPVESL